MLRLMLADDEQYEREYLEKIIEKNYSTLLKIVYKAADGVEFMEKLNECNPHIILLDVKMPRMDGLETAKQIREIYPDVQIVIVSAYSDFNYAKQAMKLGISEYLLKPYTDSELLRTLDRVIVRIREREDTLSMLTYFNPADNHKVVDLVKDLEKDFIWDLFFRRRSIEEVKKIARTGGFYEKWTKVVLISSSALAPMGDFSQEVLKSYFRMDGVAVYNSIWMSQMAICLFAEDKDAFTELNGCIKRARDYLIEEHQIPVACGVSGTYFGIEQFAEAYDEAAAFIMEFSDSNIQNEFMNATDSLKKLCELEDRIADAIADEEKNEAIYFLSEVIEILEKGLEYQDIAVKLNFSRSLLTIIQAINKKPGIRVKTAEVMRQFEKLEELNFNGDNLKYHLDFFVDIQIEKMS